MQHHPENGQAVTSHDEHPLTNAQIDAIADKAARRALQLVYAEVGQAVVKKLFLIAGAVTVGLALWLAGKDALK